jgi:hypothetical protein
MAAQLGVLTSIVVEVVAVMLMRLCSATAEWYARARTRRCPLLKTSVSRHGDGS